MNSKEIQAFILGYALWMLTMAAFTLLVTLVRFQSIALALMVVSAIIPIVFSYRWYVAKD